MWWRENQTLLAYLAGGLLLSVVAIVVARVGRPEKRPLVRVAVVGVAMLAVGTALLWFDCEARVIVCVLAVVLAASVGFREGQTVALGRSLGKTKFAVYISCVVTLAALIYFHLPITTFLTSPGEIGIHLDHLVTGNLRSAAVIVYLAAAFYGIAVSPRMRSVLTLVALVAVVVGLAYSYAYPLGYPAMHGLEFEQLPIPPWAVAARGAVDVATIVVAVVLSAVALGRLGGRKVLGAILLVNVSLILASGYRMLREPWTEPGGAGTTRSFPQPIRFSRSERNVLVLMVDRFMGGFVEEILRDEPQLASELDGFVWYPRTVAAGENSIAGVHPLLGGYDYTPREMNKRDRALAELSVEAFSILPYNFTRKGYRANLVNPHGLNFTMEGDCDSLDIEGLSCSHIPAAAWRRLADQHRIPVRVLAEAEYTDLLVLLALMRALPYVPKAILRERGPWRPFLDHSAGTTFREWATLRSLPELSALDSDEANINIVFNMLPHEPYYLGEDCTPRRTRLNVSDREARRRGRSDLFDLQHYIGARCTLLLVADYLQWMRESGVYDDTKIVIVSDHGIAGHTRDQSSRAVKGRTTLNIYVRSRSVLFVKDRGAHGPLRTSEEFLPNAEVPRIVCEEIGGCVNPYLGNKTIEAHGRDVPFFVTFVPWQFNLQERTRFTIRKERMLIDRDPYKARSWKVPPRGD